MSLERRINQADCVHKVLRADKPMTDLDGKKIAQFTCEHPVYPHCGGTFSGRGHEKGRVYIGFRFFGTERRSYFMKVTE